MEQLWIEAGEKVELAKEGKYPSQGSIDYKHVCHNAPPHD